MSNFWNFNHFIIFNHSLSNDEGIKFYLIEVFGTGLGLGLDNMTIDNSNSLYCKSSCKTPPETI